MQHWTCGIVCIAYGLTLPFPKNPGWVELDTAYSPLVIDIDSKLMVGPHKISIRHQSLVLPSNICFL